MEQNYASVWYDEETNIPVLDKILYQIAGENERTIGVETFIAKDDLNIMTISNSYYLIPGKGADKGYVILREALKSTKKIGIAKVIISTKEYLAAVMPYNDALVMSLLRYKDETRDISEFTLPKKELKAYKINKKEMEMANKLINSMSSRWRPEKFKDEYQQAIHKWVDESVRDLPHSVMKRKKAAKPERVVNFVDLLKKSLQTNNKKGVVRSKKHVPHRVNKSNNHRHVVRH